MQELLIAVLAVYLLGAQGKKADDSSNEEHQSLARGFGDDIKWVPWERALSTAKLFNKPVFLLIHKSWCEACQALKSEFKNSNQRGELVKLSKKFVMVNTEDDEEPADERYAPDGGYIPRLFFLDSNGDVMEGTENSNYPNNKHYFPRIPVIIEKMKYALEAFGTPLNNDEKATKKESEKRRKERSDEPDEGNKEAKSSNKEEKAKDKSKESKKSKNEKKRKSEL